MSSLVVQGGTGTVWPQNGGRVTLSTEFYERELEKPCRGICAHCGECFDGTFREERSWFKEHVCAMRLVA